MKKLFLSYLIPAIITGGFCISCKKERSCEGCKENNKPPIAIAGPDQVITLPTDSISLDGSASNDPDGTISEWLWKKISGPASFIFNNSSSSTSVIKNNSKGTSKKMDYYFELSVVFNQQINVVLLMNVVIIFFT